MARNITSETDFLKKARERFELANRAEAAWRPDCLDDWMFSSGEQWPADIRTARVQDGRPCLTMNRFPTIIAQITNDERQQRPSVNVNPVGDGADKETADVFQGIVRHIEVRSDAEIARDTAFEQMVTGGFGHYRILTEYADDTFDQEIRISTIQNPFVVYTDPSACEPGWVDAKWRFIIADYTPEQYKEKYPKSPLSTLSSWESLGDRTPGWYPNGGIRVAEYFYMEEDEVTLYELHDGTTTEEKPSRKEDIRNERPYTKPSVKWAKITADEILEEGECAGKWIPIITVLGRDYDINGERKISGIIRSLKDPQRQYNYFQSAATEAIALAPKAPWIAAKGQLENEEQKWGTANVKNYAYLEYNPKDIGGTALPAPQRSSVEPPIQAMTLMVRQADQDLKAISGLYDPSLGENKQDLSGKAISALQRQGQVSNVNWIDNLARTIRVEGRMLLDLIPKIYDSARVQRIISPDGSEKHVVIHNGLDQFEQAQQLAMDNQITKIYDISQGRYDVTISVGPSYQSKRQEAVASIVQLVNAYPPLMQVSGDILMRNMDIPGAEEIAERLAKLLPPQLQDGNDPQATLQQAQAQLQQLAQQHQQLTGLLQQQHEIIQSKQVENAAKVEIEKMRDSTQVTIAEINTQHQQVMARLEWEQEMWKELHGSAHEVGLQADQQAHEQAQAQQAQQAAQQQQESAQAAEQQPQGAEAEPAGVQQGG